jgi:hypothetical protein
MTAYSSEFASLLAAHSRSDLARHVRVAIFMWHSYLEGRSRRILSK